MLVVIIVEDLLDDNDDDEMDGDEEIGGQVGAEGSPSIGDIREEEWWNRGHYPNTNSNR